MSAVKRLGDVWGISQYKLNDNKNGHQPSFDTMVLGASDTPLKKLTLTYRTHSRVPRVCSTICQAVVQTMEAEPWSKRRRRVESQRQQRCIFSFSRIQQVKPSWKDATGQEQDDCFTKIKPSKLHIAHHSFFWDKDSYSSNNNERDKTNQTADSHIMDVPLLCCSYHACLSPLFRQCPALAHSCQQRHAMCYVLHNNSCTITNNGDA